MRNAMQMTNQLTNEVIIVLSSLLLPSFFTNLMKETLTLMNSNEGFNYKSCEYQIAMDEVFIEELSAYKHVTTNITQYWNVLLLLPS